MPPRKPLRAVKPDETASKSEPRTLLEAVKSGDYIAELRLTHLRIAQTVSNPETSPRDLASLTRRQLEISKELRAAELAKEQDGEGRAPVADEEFDASAV